MPLYNYEALNATGKTIKNQIEATSTEDAILHIKMMGYFPTSVRETKKAASSQYQIRPQEDASISNSSYLLRVFLLGAIAGTLFGASTTALVCFLLWQK